MHDFIKHVVVDVVTLLRKIPPPLGLIIILVQVFIKHVDAVTLLRKIPPPSWLKLKLLVQGFIKHVDVVILRKISSLSA